MADPNEHAEQVDGVANPNENTERVDGVLKVSVYPKIDNFVKF